MRSNTLTIHERGDVDSSFKVPESKIIFFANIASTDDPQHYSHAKYPTYEQLKGVLQENKHMHVVIAQNLYSHGEYKRNKTSTPFVNN